MPAGTLDPGIDPGTNDSAPQHAPELLHCYVCKQKYTRVHHFYDQLCPECAEFNFAKRSESADLRGRVALLTGGRVKRSEEHTSELQSLMRISYAVFCLKKKTNTLHPALKHSAST